MIIAYGMTTSPAIVPNLQAGDHTPDLLQNKDVWFERGLPFRSENSKPVLELLRDFFDTYAT